MANRHSESAKAISVPNWKLDEFFGEIDGNKEQKCRRGDQKHRMIKTRRDIEGGSKWDARRIYIKSGMCNNGIIFAKGIIFEHK